MSNIVLQGLPQEGLTPQAIEASLTTTAKNRINNLQQELLNFAFPIGCIHITSNTENPSVYLGGVWERISDNNTLISAGDATPSHSKVYRTTADGAKFELIFQQKLDDVTDCIEKSDAEHDLFILNNVTHFYGKNNCSYLNHLDDYYNQDGTIELLCSWTPFSGEKVEGRWIQGMKPDAGIGNVNLYNLTLDGQRYSGTATGVTSVENGLYIPWTDSNWVGFRKSTRQDYAYISGRNRVYNDWWYPIGQFAKEATHNGVLGSPNTSYNQVQLYARVDNIGNNFEINNYYGKAGVVLGINQMRTHTHGVGGTKRFYESSTKDAYDYCGGSSASGRYSSYEGGNGAHNNLQPYIKTYIWKRIQ